MTPMTQPDGRRGTQVQIPLSLGPRKEGQDKEGGVCLVFDFVVAPATLDATLVRPGLMQTLAETVSVGCGVHQLQLKS